jgi:hypothetical protein
VSTPPLETRLGAEFGRLTNVSATGALVRTGVPFTTGRQCPMIVNLPDAPAALSVRIVRSEPVPVELPGAVSQLPQYLVGVRFAAISASAKHAIATLCGAAFLQHEENRRAAGTDARGRPATPDDQFFDALDGAALVLGTDRWRLEVYSVLVHSERRWIQAAVHGPKRFELNLDAALDRTPSDVLNRLMAFFSDRRGVSIDSAVERVTVD